MIATSKLISNYQKWHNSCFRVFFILEYENLVISGNSEKRSIQQIEQFWKWHPAPVRAYSYLMTRPVIKVAEGNWICYKLKSWLTKILNSGVIPEKAWKSGGIFSCIFQVPKKKIQNNSRNSKIPEPLDTLKLNVWNYMHPPVIFVPRN